MTVDSKPASVRAPFSAVVLAAGQGTRMKSDKPKVLHELAGRPMIHYVVEAALVAGASEVVVVVGHGRQAVESYLSRTYGARVKTAVQETQEGTGHAVRCALPSVDPASDRVLLLCGDTPLLLADELADLASSLASGVPVAVLTMEPSDPTGYGRIVRDAGGKITAIREHKDTIGDERAIREVNSGVYVARAAFLRESLSTLKPDNSQQELYLTDIVSAAAKSPVGAVALKARDLASVAGINDRAQLAAAEDEIYRRNADALRRAGATVRSSAKIDTGVIVEPDATIEHHVVLRGATRVGKRAQVDVGSVLTDVIVAPGAVLKPYTVAQKSMIGEAAQIGPFSHLRPDSEIEAEAHVGNFVETKKTIVRRGAKANHLAYLGDGDIGEGANVGAGTIFCNYDGFKKHRTVIGKNAFIGSDSQLVAPVTIGDGAYVGTGTTVTKDVPADALAIGRAKQENKEGYASRLRGRLKAASGK
jgi:bifunctional UDP-N-acetylglucosamine pyrophosphorylase/glucosamine-1-phosphate N-acetyltransferase